jgi:surfeit locus 1 family protein
LKRVLPPLFGVMLVVAFVSLGMWQLDRASYKRQMASSFEAAGDHTRILGDMPVAPYQALKTYGRYLGDRQILIDNIVKQGRLGYYVITPFEYSADEPLLAVNRGWVPRPRERGALPVVAPLPDKLEVRGRAGNLPRVGIRPGEAFEGIQSWPRVAVYPTLDEVADQIGEPVLPFVLLLDADPSSEMLREWRPVQSGPATHYGYAFQWFAMAAAVAGIGIWNLTKKPGDASTQA